MITKSTKTLVAKMRRLRLEDPTAYRILYDAIGKLASLRENRQAPLRSKKK